MISVSLLKKRAVRHVKVNDELELPMVFSPMVMDAYLKNNKMNTLQFQDQLSKDPFSCGGLFWTAFCTGLEFLGEDNPFQSEKDFLNCLSYDDYMSLMNAYTDSLPKGEGSEATTDALGNLPSQ